MFTKLRTLHSVMQRLKINFILGVQNFQLAECLKYWRTCRLLKRIKSTEESKYISKLGVNNEHLKDCYSIYL